MLCLYLASLLRARLCRSGLKACHGILKPRLLWTHDCCVGRCDSLRLVRSCYQRIQLIHLRSHAARATARATHVEPEVKTVIPSARLPNGMTWSADGRTMFWIDTATNVVDAFDFDATAGSLSNRRTVVTCPRQGASVHGAVGGVPDGMTIDASGKLWVVLGESGCVVQVWLASLCKRHLRL